MSQVNPAESLARDLELLRRSLARELARVAPVTGTAPALVVLSGLPGTGKSHFARELVRRLPFLVLGSDRLRKTLVARPSYTPGEHARVFNAGHQLAEESLARGQRVIFDATSLSEGSREHLYGLAEGVGARLVLVRCTAPGEVVQQRLAERASGQGISNYSDADWRIYCRLRPFEEPIRRPHLLVDSSRDIAPAVAEVLRRVLAPEAG